MPRGSRYDDYASILARFGSRGTCGHEIRPGDRIGWSRRGRRALCADCWATWRAEVAQASAVEAGYAPTVY